LAIQSAVEASLSRLMNVRSSKMGRRDSAAWVLRRGALPALRGLARAPLYGACSLPVAIGANVMILNGSHLRMGRSVIIGNHSWLSCFSTLGVELGDGVTLREFAWLQCTSNPSSPGEGIRIGSGTYIGPRCYLGVGGFVSIGENCDIGASFSVIAENHVIPAAGHQLRGSGVERRGIAIEDQCWIGNNVTILDGVRVGQGAVLAAGSVVTRDVTAGAVMAGVPARVLRHRLNTLNPTDA
jgi:acetyltransferase-like isoleucine patch superfamily enzyme